MLGTLGDVVLALSNVQKWAAEFSMEREGLEDDPKSRRSEIPPSKRALIVFTT